MGRGVCLFFPLVPEEKTGYILWSLTSRDGNGT